ncbi:MAG: alternative ribosome rescue aminoacyl-tRNA hydrolase ArfB [Candidatus Kapaibacterium sp.]
MNSEETERQNIIEVTPNLRIPMAEINFRFVRSSGPGGQHVNKTSTQVELTFDLAHSPSIREDDRLWLMQRLSSRLDTDGVLQITAQEHRSQLRNKTEATRKLVQLLADGFKRPKRRKPTKSTRGAKEARIASKKIHGAKKKARSRKEED